jgi:heme oxygenase
MAGSEVTDLWLLLRSATADAHARLDAALPFLDGDLDRSTYGDALEDLYRAHKPVEDAITDVLADEPADREALGWPARARASLLQRDLDALGRSSLSTFDRPALHGVAAAVGVLYVIEGARLGGRVITRHVREALGPDTPVAYFSGDGQAPGTFRVLREVATARLGSAAERGVAVRAAQSTFDLFERAVAA